MQFTNFTKMEINELPPELTITILKFISKEEILTTVRNVCQAWRQLAVSASLWTHVDFDRLDLQSLLGQDKLFSIMSNVLSNVQYLKVSPKLFESYIAQTKAATFRNLHTLQLSYSRNYMNYVSKLLPLVQRKCPHLKEIHLGVFFGDDSSIMESFLTRKMNLSHVHFYGYNQHSQKLEESGNDESDNDEEYLYIDPYPADHETEEIENIKRIFQDYTDTIRTYKSISLHSMQGNHINVFLERELPNLKSLDGSFIIKKTLNAIAANGTSLTDLKLGYSSLDDRCFSVLIGKLPNLKRLNLYCWDMLSDKVVSDLIVSCDKLEEISIRNSTVKANYYNLASDESKLTLAVVPSPTKIKALKSLAIQNMKAIDNVFLTDLMQNVHLVSLSFNSCHSLCDTALEIIATNCRCLQSADFSQCSKITLPGVKKLLSTCVSLVNLSLLACEGLTHFTDSYSDSAIITSAKNPISAAVGATNLSNSEYSQSDCGEKVMSKNNKSQLENLNMAYCINLETSALVVLTGLCENLRLLNLRFCDLLESLEAEAQTLFQNCSHLKTIYFGLNSHVMRS